MKIAIIGYGKMGHEIESVATQRGHCISKIFDNENTLSVTELENIDVAIEFSTPNTAPANYNICLQANVPVVSGTTGWIENIDEIKDLCNAKNGTFFYASNFSLGVNLFFKINSFLAKLIANTSDYSPLITETHHTEKLDSPSGTALTLANQISEAFKQNKRKEVNIPINSIRKVNVPGIHTISYNSSVDTIEITHSAKSRKGFALGAVLAAEFCLNKKGWLTMENLLNF